jgi:hypothetical protein
MTDDGRYDASIRMMKAATKGYHTKSAREIFTERSINNAMDPNGVDVRESRDSDEHPNSLAIVLALDETGSMGSIPHHLIKEGLPETMGGIIQRGIKDPQVLFLGIGDHECDRAPLQVGQFESSDDMLDHWLEKLYLEGNGGGNNGESYMLAWYFAGLHTAIDCWEKRQQKGFLFTIGDEPTLPQLPKHAIQKIMGSAQASNMTSVELLDKAREKYEVYHFHVKQGSNGRRQDVMDGWKQLMGQDNLVIVDDYQDIPRKIAEIVTTKASHLIDGVPEPADPTEAAASESGDITDGLAEDTPDTATTAPVEDML